MGTRWTEDCFMWVDVNIGMMQLVWIEIQIYLHVYFHSATVSQFMAAKLYQDYFDFLFWFSELVLNFRLIHNQN